uniref:SnoaL-like domain-containing protein n=1 Tax=Steinernema glaseri TaxID=37863 RepID=A0A1I7Y4B9_9BILA
MMSTYSALLRRFRSIEVTPYNDSNTMDLLRFMASSGRLQSVHITQEVAVTRDTSSLVDSFISNFSPKFSDVLGDVDVTAKVVDQWTLIYHGFLTKSGELFERGYSEEHMVNGQIPVKSIKIKFGKKV